MGGISTVNTVRSRLLAAATTLVVAGAAVLGGATAASAGVGPSLEIGHASGTVVTQGLVFDVSHEGGCAIVESSAQAWIYPTESSWEAVQPTALTIDWVGPTWGQITVPAIGYGNSVRVGAFASFDCDGMTSERFAGVTPSDPAAVIDGQAYVHNGIGGWNYPENAPAALLRASDGPDGTPVATSSVLSWGGFSFDVPLESVSDWEAEYRIRVSVPGHPVTYYSAGAGDNTNDPSTTSWDDATSVRLADGVTRYGVFVRQPVTGSGEDTDTDTDTGPTVPAMPQTDLELVCYESGSLYSDVETATVDWSDVCHTDGTLDDAETAHRSDAFDVIGHIAFSVPGARTPHVKDDIESEDYYFVTSGEVSTSESEGVTTFTLRDQGIRVFDTEGQPVDVDVEIVRVIEGSWMSWAVRVYLAGTDELATDVPFWFLGDANTDTDWVLGDGAAVAIDEEGASDPVVGHVYDATGVLQTGYYDDDNGSFALASRGSLDYAVGIFDYCAMEPGFADEALEIIQGADVIGTDLEMLGSGICPTWSIPAPTLTVGVPFDQTYTAPLDGWNWKYGGWADAWNLPAGLEVETLDAREYGTAPSIRIFGTPLEAGPYEFDVEVYDDYNDYEFTVNGTVAPAGSNDDSDDDDTSSGDGDDPSTEIPVTTPAQRDLSLELELQIGGTVSGSSATATATGLQEGAAYDIVVRSTPQTLASGVVPAGGTVTRTVTLPALEAGWHSLTFTSTWNGGGAAVSRVWFEVGADGTLLRTSSTAPALADTGAEAAGTLFAAGILLLVGFGLVALRRRGTVTSAA
jgi:LPXTG-motif cell wall-anchored protein